MKPSNPYLSFLKNKQQFSEDMGFSPLFFHDKLKDFQRHLVEWSVRKGRSAIFADCGLGKTLMQLVYATNIVRKTNGRVLLLTPLAVGQQTVRESEKFGIDDVSQSRDGSLRSKIVVTNYEQLTKFTPSDFEAVVCDESSILKNFDGKIKTQVTEFVRTLPYRLLCTATAAPNDYHELGTSSEALGELGYHDMVTRFFVEEKTDFGIGHGRKSKYRLRGHAEQAFWKWVCSWARACRKPSDLGFDDAGYELPELVERVHEVSASRPADGRLFDVPAVSLEEQREEQRRTVPDRCNKAAELIDSKRSAVMWCHRNDEGDLLEKLVKGSVQVSGADSDEEKEEKLTAFSRGEIPVLITKPKIGAFGLNWQHCSHVTFFPSHSYEQYYQAVRRCWRFGQKNSVTVDLITTDGGERVLASQQSKSRAADAMFAELVRHMNDSMRIKATKYGTTKEELPRWLLSSKA